MNQLNPAAVEALAFGEAVTRIETLFYIPSLLGEDPPRSFNDEFVDYLPEREGAQLYVELPQLLAFREDNCAFVDHVLEELRDVPGFLVCAATPHVQPTKGGGFSYSWSNYWTEWLYAPDQASIVKVCAEWAGHMRSDDRQAAA